MYLTTHSKSNLKFKPISAQKYKVK